MSLPLGSRVRLMLIEHDQMVRETLLLMLQDDYDVIHAATSSAALAELTGPSTTAIELVLVDTVSMEGHLDGILVAADRLGIPVVLISGDPSQREALEPSRLFLAKPFTQPALLAALDSARR